VEVGVLVQLVNKKCDDYKKIFYLFKLINKMFSRKRASPEKRLRDVDFEVVKKQKLKDSFSEILKEDMQFVDVIMEEDKKLDELTLELDNLVVVPMDISVVGSPVKEIPTFEEEQVSEEYRPKSPEYKPSDKEEEQVSEEYRPKSPEYKPSDKEEQVSEEYRPKSPEYKPSEKEEEQVSEEYEPYEEEEVEAIGSPMEIIPYSISPGSPMQISPVVPQKRILPESFKKRLSEISKLDTKEKYTTVSELLTDVSDIENNVSEVSTEVSEDNEDRYSEASIEVSENDNEDRYSEASTEVSEEEPEIFEIKSKEFIDEEDEDEEDEMMDIDEDYELKTKLEKIKEQMGGNITLDQINKALFELEEDMYKQKKQTYGSKCSLNFNFQFRYNNSILYVSDILGEGGFGCVYLLKEKDNEKKTYILKQTMINDSELQSKEILSKLEEYPKFISRYIEALRFPGITNSEFLLIEPFIDETTGKSAVSLSSLLYDKTKWDFKFMLKVYNNILEAVEYLHRNKIVHNDLKPQNILCKRNGEIQLIDFGAICIPKIECSTAHTPVYIEKRIFNQNLGQDSRTNQIYQIYHPYNDLAALNVIFFDLIEKCQPVKLSDITLSKNKLEKMLNVSINLNYKKQMDLMDGWEFVYDNRFITYRIDNDPDNNENMIIKFDLYKKFYNHIVKLKTLDIKELVMIFLFFKMYFYVIDIKNIISLVYEKLNVNKQPKRLKRKRLQIGGGRIEDLISQYFPGLKKKSPKNIEIQTKTDEDIKQSSIILSLAPEEVLKKSESEKTLVKSDSQATLVGREETNNKFLTENKQKLKRRLDNIIKEYRKHTYLEKYKTQLNNPDYYLSKTKEQINKLNIEKGIVERHLEKLNEIFKNYLKRQIELAKIQKMISEAKNRDDLEKIKKELIKEEEEYLSKKYQLQSDIYKQIISETNKETSDLTSRKNINY
jgi:serine/threonine protein kinase